MTPQPSENHSPRLELDESLPDLPEFVKGIRRAPDRGFRLTSNQTETALKNALNVQLCEEFA